jgi:hypothetical protein
MSLFSLGIDGQLDIEDCDETGLFDEVDLTIVTLNSLPANSQPNSSTFRLEWIRRREGGEYGLNLFVWNAIPFVADPQEHHVALSFLRCHPRVGEKSRWRASSKRAVQQALGPLQGSWRGLLWDERRDQSQAWLNSRHHR